jgi:hypothetical protein
MAPMSRSPVAIGTAQIVAPREVLPRNRRAAAAESPADSAAFQASRCETRSGVSLALVSSDPCPTPVLCNHRLGLGDNGVAVAFEKGSQGCRG